jgi:hypothetical protein
VCLWKAVRRTHLLLCFELLLPTRLGLALFLSPLSRLKLVVVLLFPQCLLELVTLFLEPPPSVRLGPTSLLKLCYAVSQFLDLVAQKRGLRLVGRSSL